MISLGDFLGRAPGADGTADLSLRGLTWAVLGK